MTSPTNRDARERLERRLSEIGGCSDGNCVVVKPTGMHTNGGCKCLRNFLTAQRVVNAYKVAVEALLSPDEVEGMGSRRAEIAGAIACDPAYLAEVRDEQQTWLALHLADNIVSLLADQPLPSVATGHPEQGALLSPQAALNDVAAERARQIAVEGWATDHDDEHSGGEMAYAAACYAIHAAKPEVPGKSGLANGYRIIQELWPWDWRWWKASTKRRDLVKAGALILAEIERLDRLSSAVQTAEAVPGTSKNGNYIFDSPIIPG